jgi:pimeloyl-ACP methyl ester carboxylesterase
MPATSDIRAEDTLRLGMDGTLDATLRRWFSPRALARRDHPGVAYARRRLLADDPVVVSKTWSILGTHSLREELLGIAAPVTVLGGRDDAAVPIGRLLELYEFLPKARLEVLPGPHMLPLEEPGAFANAVMRHLTWASLRTG